MRTDRWLHRLGLAVLSVLLVGTIWAVPYLPTTDGPEWIFATHAENHYTDPGAPYSRDLIPLPQFASHGMSIVYGPLESWLGWRRGLQVALSLIVLGTAWGFVALVRALERERTAVGFLGFPLALSWAFYMGFWPFVVSLALGGFIIALAVRSRRPGARDRALLGALLLVQAVAHVFGALLTGIVVAVVRVSRVGRAERLAELARVALTGTPAACILLACMWSSRDIANVPLVHDFVRLSAHDALSVFPRVVLPGPEPRALIGTGLVLVAAVLAAARTSRREVPVEDRALGALAGMFLLAALALPFQIPGWQFFSQRFVPLGSALALAVLPLECSRPVVRTVAAGVMFLASAASLVTTYPFHRRLAALCPSAIRGLEAPVRSTGEVLAISARPTERAAYDLREGEVPFLNPLLHMGTLYAVVLGGIPAVSFTGIPAIHAFARRPTERPRPSVEHYAAAMSSYAFSHDLHARQAILDELATYGLYYDEVALFGGIPSDDILFEQRGYMKDWGLGATFVAHFVPCTIDFRMPVTLATPAPTFDVGVGHVKVLSDRRPPLVVGADGRAHFALTPSPCGSVAVQPRWADGTRCRNADEAGAVRGDVTRTSSTIDCELP